MRMRALRPGWWQDRTLASEPAAVRLLLLALTSMADDAGRLLDDPAAVAAFAFPGGDDAAVGRGLTRLAALGRIVRGTTADGRAVIQIIGWEADQRVNHPGARVLPPVADAPVLALFPDLPPPIDPEDAWRADFEAAWTAYPRRPNNSKQAAWRAYRARRVEGVPAAVLAEGVTAYAAYCQREGITPQYVKLAATFFGPGGHYAADYTPLAAAIPPYPPEVMACRTPDGTFRLYDEQDQPTAAFHYLTRQRVA